MAKKKSGRTVKKVNKDSTGFIELEHTVPEEVDDDGIGSEIEPEIVGKGETNAKQETGVVHEPSFTAISDNTSDLGIQETNEEVEPERYGSGGEENHETTSVIKEDTIDTGMEIHDRPVDIVEEKSVLERNKGPTPGDKIRITELNKAAGFMLGCLSKGIKHEFEMAAKDYDIKDIGIYVLGILNRLYKAVDLYDPDFEPEWEYGVVGQDVDLYCDYCNKVIQKPKNPRQVYCNNLCAKYGRERDTTGIVQPNERYDGTEAELDAVAWEREQKQLGAN